MTRRQQGAIPDEAPVLLSKREQWSIIQKLKEEGFVKNIKLDERKQRVWLEISKKEIYQKNPMSHIETIDDLLQNRELFEKFIQIIDIQNIKSRHTYIISTREGKCRPSSTIG